MTARIGPHAVFICQPCQKCHEIRLPLGQTPRSDFHLDTRRVFRPAGSASEGIQKWHRCWGAWNIGWRPSANLQRSNRHSQPNKRKSPLSTNFQQGPDAAVGWVEYSGGARRRQKTRTREQKRIKFRRSLNSQSAVKRQLTKNRKCPHFLEVVRKSLQRFQPHPPQNFHNVFVSSIGCDSTASTHRCGR